MCGRFVDVLSCRRRGIEGLVMAVCCEGVETGAAVTVRSERIEEEGLRDGSELCERRS